MYKLTDIAVTRFMVHFNGQRKERDKEKREGVLDLTAQGLECKVNSGKKLPREFYGPKQEYIDPDNERYTYYLEDGPPPSWVLNNERIADNVNDSSSNIDESDFVMKATDQIEPYIGIANEGRNKDLGYQSQARQRYETPNPEPNEISRLESQGATNVTETVYSSVTGRTTVTRGSLSSVTETY